MKIGFACKYLHPDQTQKKKLLEEIQRPLTEKSTTIRWLNETNTRSCRTTFVGYYGTQYTSSLQPCRICRQSSRESTNGSIR